LDLSNYEKSHQDSQHSSDGMKNVEVDKPRSRILGVEQCLLPHSLDISNLYLKLGTQPNDFVINSVSLSFIPEQLSCLHQVFLLEGPSNSQKGDTKIFCNNIYF